MIEKISQKLESKNIKLKGTLCVELIGDGYNAKIYDMHLTTFKRTLIGCWFADTEQLKVF